MHHEYYSHHFTGDAETPEEDVDIYQHLPGLPINDMQPSYHHDLYDF
jgi:hypothetical protein